MDVDTTVTSDINATAGGGQQHSEAKKVELMRSNSCFYCEKQGHQANICHKKQADRGNFSSHPKENVRTGNAPTMPDIKDLDNFADYLKDNMDSFSEEARLGFVEKLMPKDFPMALN